MNHKNKILKLSQIYSYDEMGKCYLAQISLDSYDELFNAWDAAPLKRKDLEPDLLDFIEQVGNDIPLKEHVKLVFQLPEKVKDDKREETSIEAIKHNFTIIRHFINKELLKNNRKIIGYLIFGMIFLSLSYLLQKILPEFFAVSLLEEGLFIGGWVMFWEAISLFFFTGSELRYRRKRYLRFSQSQIEFVYK